MKKVAVLFLALIILSDSGYAVTGFDKWSTLLNTPGLIIAQPEFAKVFGTGGLFNACTTDEQFKSIYPVIACSIDQDNSCSEPTLQQITVERIFNCNICTEKSSRSKCQKFEKVTKTYPISFFINVFEKNEKGEEVFLFAKKYTLPRCKD